MAEIKFEDALKKLEKIVSDLEAGDLSLDDSLARYEEGVRLSRSCTMKLEAAKSKVELLMHSGSKFEVKPFDSAKVESRLPSAERGRQAQKAKPKKRKPDKPDFLL